MSRANYVTFESGKFSVRFVHEQAHIGDSRKDRRRSWLAQWLETSLVSSLEIHTRGRRTVERRSRHEARPRENITRTALRARDAAIFERKPCTLSTNIELRTLLNPPALHTSKSSASLPFRTPRPLKDCLLTAKTLTSGKSLSETSSAGTVIAFLLTSKDALRDLTLLSAAPDGR